MASEQTELLSDVRENNVPRCCWRIFTHKQIVKDVSAVKLRTRTFSLSDLDGCRNRVKSVGRSWNKRKKRKRTRFYFWNYSAQVCVQVFLNWTKTTPGCFNVVYNRVLMICAPCVNSCNSYVSCMMRTLQKNSILLTKLLRARLSANVSEAK